MLKSIRKATRGKKLPPLNKHKGDRKVAIANAINESMNKVFRWPENTSLGTCQAEQCKKSGMFFFFFSFFHFLLFVHLIKNFQGEQLDLVMLWPIVVRPADALR